MSIRGHEIIAVIACDTRGKTHLVGLYSATNKATDEQCSVRIDYAQVGMRPYWSYKRILL